MGGRSAVPAPAGRCLLVFTKPAVPGRVKTRLIGHLSAASAADLHRALLDDLLVALGGGSFSIRLAVALDEGEPLPPRVGVVERVERQQGVDLGERMLRALADAGATHDRVAVVGSDLPGLDASVVERAFDRLDHGDDVVLGPTRDGGYYLLAIRPDRLDARLFSGVAWSTERVLVQTLERCAQLGLRHGLLEQGRDVDRPEDLAWLERSLRAGTLVSPRVLDWLEHQESRRVPPARLHA
jgi:rSAM/selenodomain-associated transferase 1